MTSIRLMLKIAGDGEFFLKAGADAPETLLAYQDFDGTVAISPQQLVISQSQLEATPCRIAGLGVPIDEPMRPAPMSLISVHLSVATS